MTAAGRRAGDSRCSSSGTRPSASRGRRPPAEDLLDAYGEHGLVAVVLDPDAGAARHLHASRGRARRAGRPRARGAAAAARTSTSIRREVAGAPDAGELGTEPGLELAVSASSDTSGHGSPRARCRKAIRDRSAVAASVHGSTASPSCTQAVAYGGSHQVRRRVGIVADASSIAPSATTRRATTRPSDQATSSASCHSADAASRARSSPRGAAERIVASRTPDGGRRRRSPARAARRARSPRGTTAPVPEVIR